MKKLILSVFATALFSGFAIANENTREIVFKKHDETAKLCIITVTTRDYWTGEITSVKRYEYHVETAEQCEAWQKYHKELAAAEDR